MNLYRPWANDSALLEIAAVHSSHACSPLCPDKNAMWPLEVKPLSGSDTRWFPMHSATGRGAKSGSYELGSSIYERPLLLSLMCLHEQPCTSFVSCVISSASRLCQGWNWKSRPGLKKLPWQVSHASDRLRGKLESPIPGRK